MTKTQRLLLMFAVLAVASLLHLRICKWAVFAPMDRGVRLFHVTHPGETPSDWRYSGVALRTGALGVTQGVKWGLALPVMLLGLVVYVALGWWSHDPGTTGRRPSRARRITLLVTFLLGAWILHANICEWAYKVKRNPAPQGIVFAHRGPVYTGVLLDRSQLVDGLLWGLCVPALLVAGAGYMVLEWRQRDRIRLGHCARCGYDLRGTTDAPSLVCPECGDERGTSAA